MGIKFTNAAGSAKRRQIDKYTYKNGSNSVRIFGDLLPRYTYWVKGENDKNLPMEAAERKGHWANFLHCHREGLEPISDVHSHMEMLNICHLAGISARMGRNLKWDAKNEQIIGDDEANAFLKRPYREGYEIEMKAMEPATANS